MQILPLHDMAARGQQGGSRTADNPAGDAGSSAVAALFGGLLTAQAAQASQMPQCDPAAGTPALPQAADEPARAASAHQPARVAARAEPAADQPVSREDFAAMRPALAAQGVSDKDTVELAAKVESGMTYGELSRELAARGRQSSRRTEASLNAGMAMQLGSLLTRIGFSAQEGADLVRQFSQGQGAAALQRIGEKLASLPQGKPLHIPASELNALAKAAGLDKRGRGAFSGLLKDAGGTLSLPPEGLRSMLTTLGKAASTSASGPVASTQDLVAEVARRVSAKAQGKGEGLGEGKAAAKADRLPQHDASGQAVKAGNEDFKARAAVQPGAAGDGSPKSGGDGQAAAKGRGKAVSGAASGQVKVPGAEALGDAGVEKAAAKGVEPKGLPLAGQQPQPTSAGLGSKGAARAETFRQVQSAVLENIGQGRQQLTLKLTPDELGGLTVLLNVKGNDLSAVLTADSAEAAQAITQQLGELRKALEDQGLTVGRLDVQLSDAGLGQQSGQDFSGAQGHNLLQERQERARGIRLAALRSQGGERLGSSAAPISNAAQSGLDVIA